MTARQFAAKLEKLADSVEDLCEEMAKKSLELIDQGFQDAIDPRGVGWAPRRRNSRRTNPLLRDTETLREGYRIFGVNKNGFGIINDTPYAGYVNDGTGRMPARHTVPKKGEGLGTWAEPLQEVARAFIRKRLK